MKMLLAGRAAEQVVFGRVTNGAANDLERVTAIARSMVFECGMSDGVMSRTMRADNYALSEETKRMRDDEQARLTDTAYDDGRAPAAEAPRRRSTASRRRCSRRRRSSARRDRGRARRRGARVAHSETVGTMPAIAATQRSPRSQAIFAGSDPGDFSSTGEWRRQRAVTFDLT